MKSISKYVRASDASMVGGGGGGIITKLSLLLLLICSTDFDVERKHRSSAPDKKGAKG